MSDLITEFKRVIKKHSDIVDEHVKEEDYFKDYEDKVKNKRYTNFDDLKDDDYELAELFKSFILEYYLRENEINDQFYYALKK